MRKVDNREKKGVEEKKGGKEKADENSGQQSTARTPTAGTTHTRAKRTCWP